MIENHELENYRDQIRHLKVDLDLSKKNKNMFYRLWIKWSKEHRDLERAINRLNEKIKSTSQ